MAKGEVRFRLVAEVEQVKKALDEVKSQVSGLARDFANRLGPAGEVLSTLGTGGLAAAAGIGATTGAALAAGKALADWSAHLVDVGSKLTDTAAKTGLSTKALQEFAYAGSLVGVSQDEIASAALKASATLAKGGADMDATVGKLGLSLGQLNTLAPDQQFRALADAIGRIKAPGEQAAAALALFGKQGANLLPLIKAGFSGTAEEARKLGLILSEETIKAADDLGDAGTKVSAAWTALKFSLAEVIVKNPEILKSFEDLAKVIGSMSGFLRENAGAVKMLVNAYIPLTGIAASLRGMSMVLPSAGGGSYTPGVTVGGVAVGGGSRNGLFNDPLRAAGIDKKRAEEHKRAAEAAKRHAEEIKKLRDSYNGLGASEEMAKLLEAFPNLSGVAAPLLDDLAKRVEALVEKGAQLPAAFAGLQDMFKPMNRPEVRALVEQAQRNAVVSPGATGELDAATQRQLFALRELNFVVDEGSGLWTRYGDVVEQELENAATKTEEAKVEAIDWSSTLADVANAVQALGPGFAGIGRFIGGISAGMAGLKNINLKNANGGFSLTGGKGFGGLLGNITGGLQVAGAAIGIGKAIVGLFKSDPIKKAQKEAGRTLGVGISRELAEAISKQAKSLGISVGNASLLNISKAMAESGKDARSFSGQVSSLLNAIKSGAVPASEGIQQLGESFNAMAEAALKAGSVGDRALVSIIKQAREQGVESPEIKAFVAEQLSRAATGVGGMVSSLKPQTEADAKAQATIFSAAFWATVKEKGILGAADAFKESFAKLSESGFDVSAILGPVDRIMGLAGNEAFRGAAEGANSLKEALEGIANAGYLTTDSFAAFQQQAGAAFQKAIEGGASSAEAFQTIAPLLQSLLSASQNYGINLDEGTKAMIEQAKAAGVAFKTEPIDRVASALERLIPAFEKLVGLSHEAADGIGGMASAAGGLSGFGSMNGIAKGEATPGGGIPNMALGGYVPPRPGGTIVRVGEAGQGEYIVPKSGNTGVSGMMGQTVNNINVTAPVSVPPGGLDPKSVADALIVALRNNISQIADRLTPAVA